MGLRAELHDVLVALAFPHPVYFQPPPNVVMAYPCIVYERDRARISHADDKPYNQRKRYQVTVIDRNVDSLLPDKVATLPTVVHERFFTADNLNHDVFNIFF